MTSARRFTPPGATVAKRLLLIGGAAGTGKTTLARKLSSRPGTGWLQLDTLWIAIRDAAPADSPARLKVDIDQWVRGGTETVEQLLTRHRTASAVVCDALPHALTFELQTHPVLVADGAWLLPEFVQRLRLPGVDVDAVFLIEDDQVQLTRAISSRRHLEQAAPWHADSVQLAWSYGQWLADDAHAAGLAVVAARPYETVLERVLASAPRFAA